METANLKGRTEWVLNEYENTRNDDEELVVSLWVSFYQIHKVFPLNEPKELYLLMKDLPKADDIIRCRRKIQSEGKYLPTNQQIIKLRRQKEKTFPEELGYN